MPDLKQQYNLDRYNVIDGQELHADGEGRVTRNSRSSDRDQTEVRESGKNTDDDYVSLNASSISSKDRCSPSPRNSPRSSREDSPVLSGLQNNLTAKTSDVLRCPKCNKEFSSDEHPELLEHMDSCAY